MHNSVKFELVKWYSDNKNYLDGVFLADVGSYNINGSVKDVIKNVTGFDIYEGHGVDVIISPGFIPENHRLKYGAITSVSSFQFCPDPEIYIRQILDLLCKDGLLFLTMCNSKCNVKHSTSPNKYNFVDSLRYETDELIKLFSKNFEIIEVYEINDLHNDLILKAKKK